MPRALLGAAGLGWVVAYMPMKGSDRGKDEESLY